MNFTRTLKKGMIGDDVLLAKQKLVTLGYLYAATKRTFGSDTRNSVKDFQIANGLSATGEIDSYTWAALFSEDSDAPAVEAVILPERFSPEARLAIGVALAKTTELRREMCLDVLQFAVEAENNPESMLAFYIRGGNLYNTDRSLNTMTRAKLKAYFNKASYAPYYDGGREELMLEVAEAHGYQLPGCDCSGMVVGVLRKHGVYDANFDANANTLGGSHSVRTNNPQPADFACKTGHIGLYVGGGYAVESVGGAYGIQLTKIKKRMVYNFLKGKLQNFETWEYFGDPKRY